MESLKSMPSRPHRQSGIPKVKPMPAALIARYGAGTIAIPSVEQVRQLIDQIPDGRLTTVAQLNDAVAAQLQASVGCIVSTAICAAWVAKAAALQQAASPDDRITPYWRVLKIGGEVSHKYPGGVDALIHMLEAEGHTVERVRQRFFVQAYEGKLTRFVLNSLA